MHTRYKEKHRGNKKGEWKENSIHQGRMWCNDNTNLLMEDLETVREVMVEEEVEELCAITMVNRAIFIDFTLNPIQ